MRAAIARRLALPTIFAMIVVLLAAAPAPAQPSGPDASATQSAALWDRMDEAPRSVSRTGMRAEVQTSRFVPLDLDATGMAETLDAAPLESTRAARRTPLIISLPTPRGGFARFTVEESPVVAPELAAKYPEIRTFAGQGIDDPYATIRADIGLTGFHAQVLSPNGAWYIDPYYHLDDSVYASYYGRDLQAPVDPFVEGEVEEVAATAARAGTQQRTTGTQLRTYRLALAADGEYSAFHGGTTPLVHNALVTAVNRVTGIYQTELSIKLQLVANNDSLIYLNASTDPYSNNNADALLDQNQSTIDSVIGSANYDVGHVFTTGGGGLAGLGVVGKAGQKAWGETGDSSPTGDAYWVDYVAHELGHEFGGDHTFNGIGGSCSGNANNSTAMEPGSGSSIQAYAGICGNDDLQAHSDPYFHAVSFDEIVAYTTTAGSAGNLGAAATSNNFPSVSVVGGPYTIPKRTPFALTATGSDPNGDAVTYQWEQYDGGATRALTNASKATGALFRSFVPTTSPTRTFPKMSTILSNTTNANSGACGGLPGGLPCWVEFLPTVARSMSFRVTARDNRVDGGGVNSANTTVTVANVGPFLVSSPNTGVSLAGGSAQTVTWSVAGTNVSPINTANVNILLSTDGGTTFPTTLASNTPNDGTQSVTLPNTASTQARVKVEAAGNIFFDVSDTNFTITGGGTPQQTLSVNVTGSGSVTSSPGGISCPGTCSAQFNEGASVQLTAAAVGGASFTSWSGDCSGSANPCTVSMTAARNVTATFTAGTTNYALSVAKSGTGTGTVTSSPSGINCGGTCSAQFTDGTSVQLTAAPTGGSTFTSWSGDCSGSANPCTVSMTAARNVTATFTASSGGSSDSFTSPIALTGTSVHRTGDTNVGATKESGEPNHAGYPGGHSVWYFWTPASAGTTTIDTCGSSFDTLLGVYTGAAVNALSQVASNDDTCGTGSRVNFSAQAGVTYRIAVDGYGGETGNIALNLVETVPNYTLSVAKTGTGTGNVTSSPSGIDCGATCSAPYSSGTSVQLTAAASGGGSFTSWSGACSGSANPCTVSMTAARSVTATFTAGTTNYTLNVAKNGTGSGTVTSNPSGINCGATCSAQYSSGTSVQLTAAGSSGSTFTSWSGDCSGSANPCTVSMTAARSVTAKFTAAGSSASTTTVVLSGGYGTSGIFRLYRIGTNETDTTTVSPDHTGASITNHVEKWNANLQQWVAYSGSPKTYVLDAGSQKTLSWSLLRGKYRTWSVFPGDADHLPSQSAYAYYRFTP